MLREYLQAAMDQATYEILPEDNTFYGEIPVCPGVWANEATLESCRRELESVLEDWILMGVPLGHELPEICGLKIVVREEEVA